MAYFGNSVGGFGFGSRAYYASGSLYKRHGGFELATKKFSRPYSRSVRARDLENLKSQLNIAPGIFSQNAAASEQSSILAVQRLQQRIADQSNAAASRLELTRSRLDLRV